MTAMISDPVRGDTKPELSHQEDVPTSIASRRTAASSALSYYYAKGKSPRDPPADGQAERPRDGFARPWLAQGDEPATAVLMPLLDAPGAYRIWVAAASC